MRQQLQPRLASILALLMGVGLGASQADDRESWAIALKAQLKSAHGCDLDKILFANDMPIGNNVGHEGRIRCLDGREYDFTRPSPHQKFQIKLCQPTVC